MTLKMREVGFDDTDTHMLFLVYLTALFAPIFHQKEDLHVLDYLLLSQASSPSCGISIFHQFMVFYCLSSVHGNNLGCGFMIVLDVARFVRFTTENHPCSSYEMLCGRVDVAVIL